MSRLATQPLAPAPPELPEPVEGPRRRKRVLMLTHRLPYPPDRGDRIRSYHMLKLLAQSLDVAIACTSDEPVWLQHHHLLRKIARRVAIQPISPKYTRLRSLAALYTGKAITPTCFYRQGLADTILQWQEQEPFDAVLTFCTGMIHYARLLTREGALPAGVPQPRHVLDLVDVDSAKWRAYGRRGFLPVRLIYNLEARRLRQIEAGRHDHFDAVTVVSQAEAQTYRQEVGEHAGLAVVGNGVDLNYFAPLPDCPQPTLVFVGVLNYRPNSEGITWFVQNVMPLLRRQVPEARLQIVGRHPTPRVLDLGKHPGVEVVGSVPDVRAYIREACAVIAPLQLARGVQNKVLEAMACGRPVVCSPQAAQGLHAHDDTHLLVADTPEQWLEQISRVFSDSSLRQRLGEQARRQIETHYAWERQLAPMLRLLDPALPAG